MNQALFNKVDGERPLYDQVYQTLLQQIGNGTYPVQQKLPSKQELSELFKLFDHEDFYGDTFVALEDAVDIINELSKDNIIKIATKHDTLRRPITQKWVNKTFSNVELIFFDSFDKSGIGKCDIFIDDKLEAIESMNKVADYKILFGDYDWNKDVNMIRATNWKELYKMIKNIENTIDNNKLTNNEKVVGIKRWGF